jgi:hypothetical protein
MSTGYHVIARLALEHPDRRPRDVLKEMIDREKTLAGLARHLGANRPTVRAALEAFGLRPGGPCSPEVHAEATRLGQARAKSAREIDAKIAEANLAAERDLRDMEHRSMAQRLRWLTRYQPRRSIEEWVGLEPNILDRAAAGERVDLPMTYLATVLSARAGWIAYGEHPAWWVVRAPDGRLVARGAGGDVGLLKASPTGRNTDVRFCERSEAAQARRDLAAAGVKSRIVAVAPRVPPQWRPPPMRDDRGGAP